jgi:hypothetical protein
LNFFFNDLEYMPLFERRNLIPKGDIHGSRCCTYVYKSGDPVGNIILTEILNNPDGYGKGDFLYHKWIYPKYRRTKYSRYAIGDVFHMVFMSGVANHLYTYTLANNSSGTTLWEKVDLSCPCVGVIHDSDKYLKQNYISVRRVIPTEWKTYILVEFDGEKYRKMDKAEYLSSNSHHDKELVDKWMKEMDAAAEKVRETVGVCTTN